jgi:hypothetical protein
MSTHVVTAAKSGSKTKKKPLKTTTATVAPDNLRPIVNKLVNTCHIDNESIEVCQQNCWHLDGTRRLGLFDTDDGNSIYTRGS